MKTLSIGWLVVLMVCLCSTSAQARLVAVMQQQDAVILSVNNDGLMMTSDYVPFVLANSEVSQKAAQLMGKRVHILFYVSAEKNYCVDLRSVAEPVFDIQEVPHRKNLSKGKALY